MKKVKVAGTPRLWFHHPQGGKQCPGCGHPLVEKICCEVVEELGIEDRVIAITGVGCSTRAFLNFDFDGIMTAHGRAPDVATGIKRALRGWPIIFTIQGDGDCVAIGIEALLNAAFRGEKITIIMVNNANFGTTGGQMAPTTLPGQKTTTTPEGRDVQTFGFPVHAPELLAGIRGVVYAARGALNNPANWSRTKQYIKKALQKQIDGLGLSFVEVLSPCPPNWRMSPIEALKFIEEKMIPEFPLGEFKDVESME